jgi:tetratricopeptide (TPR) repeat protein
MTVFPKARAAALAAIAADATLADAHAQLGHVYTMFDFDFAAADTSYRHALDLDPHCLVALHYMGLQSILVGRFEDAFRNLRLAQAIEPLAANISANIAMAHYYAGQYDQAIAQAEATLELAPQFAHAQSIIGRSWLRLGEVDRALQLFCQRSGETIGSAADIPAATFRPSTSPPSTPRKMTRKVHWHGLRLPWLSAHSRFAPSQSTPPSNT